MTFDLPDFLPYLLSQATERASREFQKTYRSRYGMLQTEWRVLFHLGCYGEMSARAICDRASLHKTKVSRAVAALEAKRFLERRPDEADRRIEHLGLTDRGRAAFTDLSEAARAFEARMIADLGSENAQRLRADLKRIAAPRVTRDG